MAIPTQFLTDLLGAPMRAIVQAEAMAAKATADFIKEVGFTGNNDASDPDFGTVRTVTFKYQRFKAGGGTETVTLEIPLLTLVPIPAIQVAEAEIDFQVALTVAGNSSQPKDIRKPFLTKDVVHLKGVLAPRPTATKATGNPVVNNANMGVKIKMQQADLTHGMVQLINLLDNASNEKPA